MPGVPWKAGLPPPVPWNHNPETAPASPRPRAGSTPSRQSSSPPVLVSPSGAGHLTEQITPTSSMPPSPTLQHHPNGSNMDTVKAHQRRPSSPLNVSYLPNQMSRTHSGTPPRPVTPTGSLDVDELMIIPSGAALKSAAHEDLQASFVPSGGGWKIIGRNAGGGKVEGWQQPGGYNGGHLGGFMALGISKKEKKEREREEKERIKMMRRRTTFDTTGILSHGVIPPIQESPMDSDLAPSNRLSSSGIQRSRTLPSRRKDRLLSAEDLVGGAATDKENEQRPSTVRGRKDKDKDKPEKRVLKKNRPSRTSTGLSMASGGNITSPMATSQMMTLPGVYTNEPLSIGPEQEPSGSRGSGS